MSAPVQIHGHCDPRFAAVRDAFAENLAARGDVGAAVSVTVDNVAVVDLWGGFADAARNRPWERDTVANVMSTTKGVTALAALMLVERGQLDLDAPVARYWPEFGAAGKAAIPVRWLLSHRAGLPGWREKLSADALYDWRRATDPLAAAEPWWEPGRQHGYHALTYGQLVGELIRRISGRSVGAFVRDEIAGPLGADFSIGVPAGREKHVAEILPDPPPPPGELPLALRLLANPGSHGARVFSNPGLRPGTANTAEWRAAELPAANGHTSARAIARIYGALAAGGRRESVHLLRPDTLALALEEQSHGRDAVLHFTTRFGLGFMLTLPDPPAGEDGFAPFSAGPRGFGHPGRGGSIGLGDPDARLGFGYVPNQYQTGTPGRRDRRWVTLCEAAYAALGARA
jgi:CubicO group peptidase (beta-lactamase class C family)